MENLSVLLVDDEPDVCNLLMKKLSKESPGLTIKTAYSARECLEIVKDGNVDCILSDYQMPGMDGLELLDAIRELGLDIPFIFVTGQGSEDVARQAFRSGADDYFTKEVSSFAFASRMANSIKQSVFRRKWTADILRKTAEGVNFGSGAQFFDVLSKFIATTLQVDIAFIGELREDSGSDIDTISVYAHGRHAPNFSYSLLDTPCETVVDNRPCIYPRNVQKLFPRDEMLVQMGLESYGGVPLYDSAGRAIGLLVVVHSEPLKNDDLVRTLLLILADRAAAELEKIRDERRGGGYRTVRECIDTAQWPMAIINPDRTVFMLNKAAMERGCAEKYAGSAGGLKCHNVLHGTDVKCGSGGAACPVNLAFYSGRTEKAVIRHKQPDGSDSDIEITACPLYGYDGEIKAVIEILGKEGGKDNVS